MYYMMRASAPSLHRESTDSLIGIDMFLYITYYDLSSIQYAYPA